MRIVIPLFDGFTALDAVGPYEVLKMLPGAETVFAAESVGPVRDSDRTLALTADASFDDITACDVLVVPGGRGVRDFLADEGLIAWVRRTHATTTWTTSVCTGSLALAAAGLLDGLTAACHWTAEQELNGLGAIYTKERVVFHEERRIVTSAGVSSGIDMALALAGRIAGRSTAEAIQLMIEYDPQPPFDAGSLDKAPQAAKDLLKAGLRR
ncbi:DJ-1/PfpI family protein [Streptomyces sp. NPDC006733]|uniref:DJ-1/PfpI family protein n=1 Tax=Streptomyces sp. NPDC006733 TaxID=3155460 RepID=UPI0033EC5F2E